MEGHAATMPLADPPAASPHRIQTVPGAISERAMIDALGATVMAATARLAATARRARIVVRRAGAIVMLVRLVPVTVLPRETGPHARSVPTVRGGPSAEDALIADRIVDEAPTTSACGLRAVPPRVEIAAPANANLKRIAILSVSGQFAHFTRLPRFPMALRRKCLTALLPMSSRL